MQKPSRGKTKPAKKYPQVVFKCGDVLGARRDAIIKKSKGIETEASIGRFCYQKGLEFLEKKWGMVITLAAPAAPVPLTSTAPTVGAK